MDIKHNGEKKTVKLHEEINDNMKVSTAKVPFAMTPEEMAFNSQWAAQRAQRRKSCTDKQQQSARPQDWASMAPSDNLVKSSGNIIEIGAGTSTSNNKWIETINQNIITSCQQNNRRSSENLETLKENMRNSQESMRKRSSENILTIEEASRDKGFNRVSREQINVSQVSVNNQTRNTGPPVRQVTESTESVYDSYADIRQRGKPGSLMDAHTAAIDLSNNCRQFYFSHLKSAEAIKQAVRTAKQTRALEKVEGKTCTSFDNTMDRLRSEMADLMEQDLSLMSQLLKLNDKIEEIKSRVSFRHKPDDFCSHSMSTVDFDSEFSDDDSRIDLYNASTGTRMIKSIKSLNTIKEQRNKAIVSELVSDTNTVMSEVGPIHYKKKHRKPRKRNKSVSDQDSQADDDDGCDESDTSEHEASDSDTDSTLSYKSRLSTNSLSDSGESDECEDQTDDGNDSSLAEKPPELPPKKRKGGVSQNSSFFKFHKSNGTPSFSNLASSSVLTKQGHNISAEKYYVPQGLVYLKHANAENVFCQFTH